MCQQSLLASFSPQRIVHFFHLVILIGAKVLAILRRCLYCNCTSVRYCPLQEVMLILAKFAILGTSLLGLPIFEAGRFSTVQDVK